MLDEIFKNKIILNDRIFNIETRKILFEKYIKNDDFLVCFDLVAYQGFFINLNY